MSSRDIFSMALRNLFKRKLRSALTIFAVVIGTMLIVVMISIGFGIERGFQKTIDEMGDITTKIHIYHNTGDKGKIMLDRDIDQIMKIDGVLTATPMLNTYITAASGKYSAQSINIMGIRPESMALMDFPIARGRALEKDADAMEIVFASSVPEQFMSARQRAEQEREWRKNWGRGGMVVSVASDAPAEEPEKVYNIDVLSDKIQMSFDWWFGQKNPNITGGDETETPPEDETETGTIAPKPFKPYNVVGVGVLSGDNWEYAYSNYMDIEVVKQIIQDRKKYEKAQGYRGIDNSKFEDTGYNEAIVKAKNINYVEGIIAELETMSFSYVESPIQYITGLRKQAASLQMFLGVIGFVTLFVAAIGIANTMIMSIYERTREIGVMKVIGAALRDIGKLFLVEAALIGLIGGALGVLLSLGASYLLNHIGGLLPFLDMFSTYGEQASNISYIPSWLCGLALVFSSVIGLISGFLPARRAMKLSALSAIRTE